VERVGSLGGRIGTETIGVGAGSDTRVRIRAIAVFERVIYNCFVTDPLRPERPVLEVDAVLRDGDADGPILLPAPQYMALVGGPDIADPYLRGLADQGRLVQHQGVTHVSFPTWQVVD
jgi:hypothetical protein